jgi:hypothetical protein
MPEFDDTINDEARSPLFDKNVRIRRGDGGGTVLNYPASEADVPLEVTLPPDMLASVDERCAELWAGLREPRDDLTDRSSVVRAAVAYFLLRLRQQREAAEKMQAPPVRARLRYGTPDNSGSVLLRSMTENDIYWCSDSEDGEVELPRGLADKLSSRRWKYLVAEEQVIDHLTATGQPLPRLIVQ